MCKTQQAYSMRNYMRSTVARMLQSGMQMKYTADDGCLLGQHALAQWPTKPIQAGQNPVKATEVLLMRLMTRPGSEYDCMFHQQCNAWITSRRTVLSAYEDSQSAACSKVPLCNIARRPEDAQPHRKGWTSVILSDMLEHPKPVCEEWEKATHQLKGELWSCNVE